MQFLAKHTQLKEKNNTIKRKTYHEEMSTVFLFLHPNNTQRTFEMPNECEDRHLCTLIRAQKIDSKIFCFERNMKENREIFLGFQFSCLLTFAPKPLKTTIWWKLNNTEIFTAPSLSAPSSKCGHDLKGNFRGYFFQLMPCLDSLQEAECAYVLFVVAILWITESFPLSITALLPGLMFPMFGIMPSARVSSPSNVRICLFYVVTWFEKSCL